MENLRLMLILLYGIVRLAEGLRYWVDELSNRAEYWAKRVRLDIPGFHDYTPSTTQKSAAMCISLTLSCTYFRLETAIFRYVYQLRVFIANLKCSISIETEQR